MSKRGRRVIKIVLLAYLAGVGLFIYDAAQNRETATLPGLVPATLTVPKLAADDGRLAAKRYRARESRGAAEQGALVTKEVVEALRAGGEKQLLVWDTRYLQEFLAARQKVRAGTDLKAGGTLIVGAGEELTEEVLLKLVAARDDLVDDADKKAVVGGRILVEGRGAAIGINLTMFFTWLNFLALAGALYAFLWEPVLKLLDERAEAVRQDIESAQARREEAEDLLEARQAELEELRSRRGHIIREAQAKAQGERERIIAEAKERASARAGEAEREIDALADGARSRLTAEIGDMATTLSAKILEREVSAEEHRKLIDEFLSGVEKGPRAADGPGEDG